ncbi:glycosyltransferase family 2 protein [Flavobacterium agrisoli]|uniref:Glycosyltransferase family 2 protein n=1 Tax=Flavobacterium agrisoli TaxID=2793066 RepID=A0A934PJI2_9FLAO|nr:glycosyltransferase family A protein [Flavobacterium agrisoli]MBK0368752.1 glycosyltransferase family 2 protein [Flavobacterium agrisoli]
MKRDNLDFLIPMFPFCHFSNFSILIINQTDDEYLLTSEFPTVRVINSNEIGLSKSRNLGLKNVTGKIILIADDDVVFFENFQENIIIEYNQNQDFSAICFQTITKKGHLYSKYPKERKKLNSKELRKVLSIELTFKIEDVKKENCLFNEFFGLGGKFQDSETFFFLKRMVHNGCKVIFIPLPIVIHEAFSSSDDASSDRVIYARMAGYCKSHGIFAYFFLFKYMFFLLRKYNLSVPEMKKKFGIGLSGIYDYKLILNKNLDSRYE